MRFAGIKDDKISVITENIFNSKGLQTIEVPKELSHVKSIDLIANCRVNDGKIISKFAKKLAKDMKIALISNFGTKCGIGTYSKFLYCELINYFSDYKLFIEKQDQYDIDNSIIPDNKIIPCWKRGESLLDLIHKVKEYNPDLILIQHEFGIWPNARYWLSLLSQLSDYRIIVTMHSIFPNHNDKIIYEAAIPEIIVHLQEAKDNLKNDKKVNGKIYVIPHGCYPILKQDKLWNNYKSEHTFIQQGFGFEYKNFEASIEATALLKNKYKDIYFTGLFSESQYNTGNHNIYFNKLMGLIGKYNIEESASIIRGYQSDNVIDSYLRTNKVGVFPYRAIPGHEVFGVSGAARLAMSAGIPIITSNIPHFHDIPSIKADSAKEIAEALDNFFSNKNSQLQQIEKQNKFIVENSWHEIAKHYVQVIENYNLFDI